MPSVVAVTADGEERVYHRLSSVASHIEENAKSGKYVLVLIVTNIIERSFDVDYIRTFDEWLILFWLRVTDDSSA